MPNYGYQQQYVPPRYATPDYQPRRYVPPPQPPQWNMPSQTFKSPYIPERNRQADAINRLNQDLLCRVAGGCF